MSELQQVATYEASFVVPFHLPPDLVRVGNRADSWEDAKRLSNLGGDGAFPPPPPPPPPPPMLTMEMATI